ncbi:MAG: ribosome maturation factor RimP [Christensenellales bacterium]
MKELLEKVKVYANQIAEKLGMEVVDVTFTNEYKKLNLNVFLYKKGGISLDDCETFHNALDEPLNVLEKEFPDDYVLNVSSMGLDRPIETDDDFRRNVDTEVEIFLKDPFAGKNVVRGNLISYSADEVTVSINEKGQIKKFNISRQNIRKAQPWIKF